MVEQNHQHSCMLLSMINRQLTKVSQIVFNFSKHSLYVDIKFLQCKTQLKAYALKCPYSKNIKIHQTDQKHGKTLPHLKKFLKTFVQMMKEFMTIAFCLETFREDWSEFEEFQSLIDQQAWHKDNCFFVGQAEFSSYIKTKN